MNTATEMFTSAGRLRDFSAACFRANPDYEIVPFGRLPDDAKTPLDVGMPDGFGVLLPSREGLAPKAVGTEAALLFYALREPGGLPSYLARRPATEKLEALADLVLERVIEIADAPAGPFSSGADALPRLFRRGEQRASRARLSRISHAALRYASELRTLAPGELAARLYHYNGEVHTPERGAAFARAGRALSYLRIGPPQMNDARRRGWSATDDAARGWVHFNRSRQGTTPFKLYLSPRFDSLPERFPDLFATLLATPATAFKIGADLPGLLRPDKLVAYCSSFEDLAATGERLRQDLEGCEPQGVPFTAPIDPDGLLSWGMDPPPAAEPGNGAARTSWRFWLVSRLAETLLAARGPGRPPGQSVEAALARLSIEGVDTESWTPRQGIWAGAASRA